MNQVDGVSVSDTVQLFFSSAALCGEDSEKEQWPLPGFWSFVQEEAVPQHSPWCQTLQFLPICHWCPSSCCPGAGAQRKWDWVSPKSILGPLRGHTWEPHRFFHCPNPTNFYSQKLWGLIFLTLELWARWSGVGLRSLTPNFYPPHVSVGPACSMSLHHFISTPPTRLNECDFFNFLVVRLPYSSIFWQFLLVVVL